MEKRVLGRGGPTLSVVGLGCNNFGMRIDAAGAASVVAAALDAGITHFDTAEMYGGGKSEEFLGAALGSRRGEVVIATKYSPRAEGEPYAPGVLAAHIRTAVEGSLRRLGSDYIDLYYQHFPDPEAPVQEMLETLDALVTEGKVLHIASSNVSADQIRSAESVAEQRQLARFTGVQIEWSLLAREVEQDVVPAAVSAGLGVVPYFPLASGLLTGKYNKGEPYPADSRLAAFGDAFASQLATEANFAKVEAYRAFAAAHGHSVSELAIGWLLAQPSVTSVITGATSADQITANAGALWSVTAAEAEVVAAI